MARGGVSQHVIPIIHPQFCHWLHPLRFHTPQVWGGQDTPLRARRWSLQNHFSLQVSRAGDPPKKPPTQTKTVCTNSLRKLFCLFSAHFKGKRGTVCTNCPEIVCANCLCKLFLFGRVFFGVGLPFMKFVQSPLPMCP